MAGLGFVVHGAEVAKVCVVLVGLDDGSDAGHEGLESVLAQEPRAPRVNLPILLNYFLNLSVIYKILCVYILYIIIHI